MVKSRMSISSGICWVHLELVSSKSMGMNSFVQQRTFQVQMFCCYMDHTLQLAIYRSQWRATQVLKSIRFSKKSKRDSFEINDQIIQFVWGELLSVLMMVLSIWIKRCWNDFCLQIRRKVCGRESNICLKTIKMKNIHTIKKESH